MVNSDTSLLSSTEEIKQHFVNYFQNIFYSINNCTDNSMVQDCIPNIVTQQDNMLLTENLTQKLVK